MLTVKSNIKLRWMVVCVAWIVIIALLAACQPPTTLTSDDLVGIWTSTVTDYGYVEYFEDGTWRQAYTLKQLETLNEYKGQYQLQGSRLTLQSAEDSPRCPGLEGSYQVRINEKGELEYELEADECTVRRVGITTEGPYRRVSP